MAPHIVMMLGWPINGLLPPWAHAINESGLSLRPYEDELRDKLAPIIIGWQDWFAHPDIV